MNESTIERAIDVLGKGSAVVTYGSGIAACLLVNKVCAPVKMNPVLKYAGSFIIGSMIGEYAWNKSVELWNAGKEHQKSMAALNEALGGLNGDSAKDLAVQSMKELIEEAESAAQHADE